jgi:hypothetical protein
MGYQLIEHIEVGASAPTSIEFTGIPQDGVDLVLKVSLRHNQATLSANLGIGFNNYSTAASAKTLFGDGASGLSFSTATINTPWAPAGNTTANTFGSASYYISNYSGSTAKSFSVDGVMENNLSGANSVYFGIVAGLWNSTAAITALRVDYPNASGFSQYSTASLYKITAD